MMEPIIWFDQKYASGEQATLKDILEICPQKKVKVPDRVKRDIEDELKQGLFILKGNFGYLPSIHAQTYAHLRMYSSFEDIDRQKLNQYREEYEAILLKHKDKVVFKNNFTAEKEEE